MAVEDILLISAQYPVTEKANFWPDALQWEMHLGIYSNQTTGTRSLHGTLFYCKYHLTLVVWQ
jgi:hypothetical protein